MITARDLRTLADLFEAATPRNIHRVKHANIAKPKARMLAILRGRFRKQLRTVLRAKELNLLKEADTKKPLPHQVKTALHADVAGLPLTGKEIDSFDAALGAAVTAGAHSIADKLGQEKVDTEPFVSGYLRDGGFQRISAELDKTSVDRLSFVVADAYDAGDSFEGIVSKIRGEFNKFSTTRAEMIVQTELNDAYSQGALEFARQTGAEGKSWEPDGEACPICMENADQGTIPLDDDFASGDDAPPGHPNCFLPETLISASRVSSAIRRRYEGIICVLSFAGLPDLSVTPNHPILTRRGWVSAECLQIEDDVLQCRTPSVATGGGFFNPDNNYVETRIEEVFDSLCLTRGGAACGVPVSAEAFHGDVSVDNEIDIVDAARAFTLDESNRTEDCEYLVFADGRLTRLGLFSDRSAGSLFNACDSATRSGMGSSGLQCSLIASHARSPVYPSSGSTALFESQSIPRTEDGRTTDPARRGDTEETFPFEVKVIKVSGLVRKYFDGHVFNLQTKSGVYFAGSILVHNCDCSLDVHASADEE